MRSSQRRVRLAAMALAGLVVTAGCSSKDTPAASGSSTNTPAAAASSTDAPAAAASSTDAPAAAASSTDAPAAAASSSAKQVKLQFLTFTSPNVTKSLWEQTVADVEKANPGVDIEILYTPNLDRQGYAKQLLATGQLPDILWDAPGPDFVKAKALLPFEASDLAGMNVPEGYGTINGETYNLWNGTFLAPGIYYNKSILDKAGVAVPTTWQQLLDAAAKLKATGVVPFQIQSGPDLWSAGYLLQAIVSADVLGDTPDWMVKRKAGAVKFSDPEFLAAVKKFTLLRDKGYFNSDAVSLNFAKANTAWTKGKAAMWPMGGWAGAVAVEGYEAGVFPLPREDGTKVLPTTIGGAVYVSASTKHPTEAKRVATALITSPAWQAADMKFDGVLPIVDGIKPLEGTQPAVLAAQQLVEDTSYKQVIGFGFESGDQQAPSGYADEFGKAAQGLIKGGTAEAFVATLDRKWDALAK